MTRYQKMLQKALDDVRELATAESLTIDNAALVFILLELRFIDERLQDV